MNELNELVMCINLTEGSSLINRKEEEGKGSAASTSGWSVDLQTPSGGQRNRQHESPR